VWGERRKPSGDKGKARDLGLERLRRKVGEKEEKKKLAARWEKKVRREKKGVGRPPMIGERSYWNR